MDRGVAHGRVDRGGSEEHRGPRGTGPERIRVMVGTDLIALFLAPLWAALKDRVNLKPAWHPWILVGITAAILSGTTVLHLGPGTWDDM